MVGVFKEEQSELPKNMFGIDSVTIVMMDEFWGGVKQPQKVNQGTMKIEIEIGKRKMEVIVIVGMAGDESRDKNEKS